MGTAGVLLILLGVTIAWLLGIKGLTPDQAISDVRGTVGLGQP